MKILRTFSDSSIVYCSPCTPPRCWRTSRPAAAACRPTPPRQQASPPAPPSRNRVSLSCHWNGSPLPSKAGLLFTHQTSDSESGAAVDLNPSKVCRSSRLSSHQSPLISTHSLSWEPRGVVIMIHCGTLPTHSISDHNISSETNPSRIIADRDKKINTRIIKYLLEVCCAIF